MRPILFALSLTFLFFCLLLATLKNYGINEDSPGHFLRGQTYLNKLATGKDTFNTPRHEIDLAQKRILLLT